MNAIDLPPEVSWQPPKVLSWLKPHAYGFIAAGTMIIAETAGCKWVAIDAEIAGTHRGHNKLFPAAFGTSSSASVFL